MVRPYVIIGTGAAGMAAAERIRLLKPDVPLMMLSLDEHSHSRCMLHKYLSNERDEKGLFFMPDGFFEDNNIMLGKGRAVKGINPDKHELIMEDGTQPYDKLLIATGSVFGIPPINNFRTASNVFGFRDLSDAVKMDKAIRDLDAKNVFIVGSGLVGLDVAYALIE